MSKTILIVGGCGFIGTNLIRYLLKLDTSIKIIVVDNLITGNNLVKCERVKWFFCCASKLFNLDIKEHIDEIYHLASIASPKLYKKNSLETLFCGYEITKIVLEFAKHHQSKVLFASSSEIYGEPNVPIQKETYYGNVNTVGERSCYDESKRVGETLCYIYNSKFGVDVKIARIFNTYGEYMNIHDGRIITELIRCALSKSELTIFGKGFQTRSFCYIQDTIILLTRLMKSNYNKPVNIGNDNEITINKLIDIFEQTTGKKLQVKYTEMTENDPLSRKPDLTMCKKLLGDIGYTNLKKGILKMYMHYLVLKKNNFLTF
jgi:nucleoside-diphosphate-sugar epimerase